MGALLVLAGCALFGFSAMFARVRGVFGDELEDMSHGWLVLPFSLYVLWTERDELRRSRGAPSLWGLLACLPCVLLALLGTRGLQIRFEQLGFIGLCITLPWAFYGGRCARLFVFPALFLLFTVPLSTFLDAVTIHLRLVASGTALFVLRGFGLDVVRQGTAVISQGAHPFSVDVAAPCSGMRSIFALMALTAAYAWFTQPTWLRRGALFARSVPLAVLATVFAKYVNTYATRGEYGKVKGFIRDVFAATAVLFALCIGGAYLIIPHFYVRLNVASGMLTVLILAAGFAGNVSNLFASALQGLKMFRTITVQSLISAPIRLATLLVAMPIRALSGYILGQTTPPAACSVWGRDRAS